MTKFTTKFFKDALIRALRTFAQTAVSMIVVGYKLTEVDWISIVSVSAVAAIASILTSIATGLPESTVDGNVLIDESGETSDVYTLQLNDNPETWMNKERVTLAIKHASDTNPDTKVE